MRCVLKLLAQLNDLNARFKCSLLPSAGGQSTQKWDAPKQAIGDNFNIRKISDCKKKKKKKSH